MASQPPLLQLLSCKEARDHHPDHCHLHSVPLCHIQMLSSWGCLSYLGHLAVSCGPKRGVDTFLLKLSLSRSLYFQTGTNLQPEVTMKVRDIYQLPPQSHGQKPQGISHFSFWPSLPDSWLDTDLSSDSESSSPSEKSIFKKFCAHVCTCMCT